MIDLHTEIKFNLAQLLNLERVFKCCLDLLDLFAGPGSDDHVFDVKAHIDIVVIVALAVDTLIYSTASKSNLQEYRMDHLVLCTCSSLEIVNFLIQLTHHLIGVCYAIGYSMNTTSLKLLFRKAVSASSCSIMHPFATTTASMTLIEFMFCGRVRLKEVDTELLVEPFCDKSGLVPRHMSVLVALLSEYPSASDWSDFLHLRDQLPCTRFPNEL